MRSSILAPAHPAGTRYSVIGDAQVPASFGDPSAEYRALRESAGLTDLTGLGVLEVSGADATTLIQEAVTRDVAYMTPERVVTGLLLDDDGVPVDVLVLYKIPGGFLVETSVGRGAATLQALTELAQARDFSVQIVDKAAEVAVIGVEGPLAWPVGLAALGVEVNGLPFEGVMEASVHGADVRISRTGFTSEFGFKVFGDPPVIEAVWRACAEQAVPAGFDAIELAMLEVRQPRVHREVLPGVSAIECGLNWLVDMGKPEFVGRSALAEQQDGRPERLPIGFATDGPDCPTQGAVYAGDQAIGTVIDCLDDPAHGRSLGLALVDADFAASGLSLAIAGAAGPVPVQTLSAPYRVPTSWKAVRGQ
jgi:glycine cleavage system aminomethyltransferase T